MTDRTLPGLGLKGFWALGEDGWNTDMDQNLLKLSALSQLSVISQTTALPSSPSEGNIYIVPSGAVSNANSVALYDNSAWTYLTPVAGMVAYIQDTSSYLHWSGTAWVALAVGATAFASLTDVLLTSPANGQVPIYNSSASKWENGSLATVATSGAYADLTGKPTVPTTLETLSDVTITGVATGQVPTWNGTAWVNETPSTGGGVTTYAALTDVQITSLVGNQVMLWNAGASKWENASLATVATSGAYSDLTGKPTIPANSSFNLAGLGDVVVTSPSDGQAIAWHAATSKFTNQTISGGGGGGATTFAALTDVSVSSPSVGQVPTWNGTAWQNETPSSGGGGSGSGGAVVLTPPLSTSLTAVTNLNSATLTDRTTGGIPSLAVAPGGGSGDSKLYCALQVAPSGPFSLVVKVKSSTYGTYGGWNGAGPVVYNSANGNASYFWLTPSSGPQLYGGNFSGSFNSGSAVLGANMPDGDFFQHIDYDGTNLKIGVSRNGLDVWWASTVTVASFLGAITHVGIGWSGGSANSLIFDFLHYHVGAEGTSGIVLGSSGGSGNGSPPSLTTFSEQALSSGVSVTTNYVAGKGLTMFRTDSQGGDVAAFRGTTVPASTPWTVTMRARMINLNLGYVRTGLGLYDTSSTKACVFGFNNQSGNPQISCFGLNAGLSGYGTTFGSMQISGYTPVPEWFQIQFDGTTYTFNFSYDGGTWIELATATTSSLFTATHIGAILETYGCAYDSTHRCGVVVLDYETA